MPFTGDREKLVPLQVTVDRLLTEGAGDMKMNPDKLAEPSGVTRLSAPVEPNPTVAFIVLGETTVNEATDVPPRVIAEVPIRLDPVMV